MVRKDGTPIDSWQRIAERSGSCVELKLRNIVSARALRKIRAVWCKFRNRFLFSWKPVNDAFDFINFILPLCLLLVCMRSSAKPLSVTQCLMGTKGMQPFPYTYTYGYAYKCRVILRQRRSDFWDFNK